MCTRNVTASSVASFSPLLPAGVRVSRGGALVAAVTSRALAGAYMCRADNRVHKHIQKIITVTVNGRYLLVNTYVSATPQNKRQQNMVWALF